MKKFEIGKKYFIDNEYCKLTFKVVDKREDYLFCGVPLNDIKLELVNIETKYTGDMPLVLFDFLKHWFDFGNYNHLHVYKDAYSRESVIFDGDDKYFGYWELRAGNKAK